MSCLAYWGVIDYKEVLVLSQHFRRINRNNRNPIKLKRNPTQINRNQSDSYKTEREPLEK